jgi:hypothetical protein
MEPVRDRPASSFSRLGAVTVIVGTGLYVAAISYGVTVFLHAVRILSAIPCGAAPAACVLHP